MGYSDQHIAEGSAERGLLDHVAPPVILTLAVGTSWYLLAGSDTAGLLAVIVPFLTAVLAVALGASMTTARGFAMSMVAAAAVAVGVFLGAGDLSENPEDGAYFIVLFAVVMTILMLAFWLVGVLIGAIWRRVAGR